MKKVVLLGGYGDGLVAAQVIQDMQRAGHPIELAGFLNDHAPPGSTIENIPILGKISDWPRLAADNNYYFHPALHKIKAMPERKAMLERLAIPPEKHITLAHPTAVIASSVLIQPGCLICSHVTIQPGAKLGPCTSVRAGANIGHDAVLEGFCYVGPNATMTGKSILKEGAHLGPNAVVIDGIILGHYAIAGAGAVILKNTDSYAIYLGNPARKIMTYHTTSQSSHAI
jgi:sugar O-acyltransferase (sialic acid O-acetyltransferase NeuD family)